MTIGRRGRKPNSEVRPDLVAADKIIACTVYLLDSWGFPLRPRPGTLFPSGVFEAVAFVAAESLRGRRAAKGARISNAALSAKRVEQIYRAWKQSENERRRQSHEMAMQAWSRYSVSSLRLRIPFDARHLSFRELVAALIANSGESPWAKAEDRWVIETGAPVLLLSLTPAAEREYQIGPRPWRLQQSAKPPN